MTDTFLHCLTIAAEAHKLQRRKSIDHPYINHCIRVANILKAAGLSGYVLDAAVLHDVVEDTDVTLEELKEQQVPDRALELVDLVTKWWSDHDHTDDVQKVHKPRYYIRILGDHDAICLKIADRADNLMDMRLMVSRKAVRPEYKIKDLRWASKYLDKTHAEFPPLLNMCKNDKLRLIYDLQEKALAEAIANAVPSDPSVSTD